MDLRFNPQTQQTPYQPGREPLTRGDKAIDFMNSAIPTALDAGAYALSAQSGTSALAASQGVGAVGAASTLGSSATIAGGILGAIQIAMNWGKSSPSAGTASGMAVGASIGTMILPGFGTAIGAGIGAIAGGLIGCITGGKHRDQKVRDSVRESLIGAGVLNSDYQLQLPDGSFYDMGKDGGPREEFGGRRPFEVDFSNPLAQYAVGWMNPLIALLAPGNTKVATDFTGYFANAALSNAKDLNDVRRNVDFLLAKFGLNNDKLAQGVVELAKGGYVDEATARVWIGGIQQRANPQFRGDFEMTLKNTPNSEPQTAQG